MHRLCPDQPIMEYDAIYSIRDASAGSIPEPSYEEITTVFKPVSVPYSA
jgi:hypothetical protein